VLIFIADPSQSRVEVEMLLDSQSWPEDIELRAHSHLQVNHIDLIFDTVSADMSITGSWPENSSDHGEKSSLTCSIRPQQSKNAFIFNHQMKPINC
jgi:hypothetical protein